MQWSDITSPPSHKTLRQFAGIWLVFFGGMAIWRAWHLQFDTRAQVTAMAAVVVGGMGLVRPATVRLIFTAWMIAAFPIGWAVSKIMLGAAFFFVFTPVSVLFRLLGRDELMRSKRTRDTYWATRTSTRNVKEYFRQF